MLFVSEKSRGDGSCDEVREAQKLRVFSGSNKAFMHETISQSDCLQPPFTFNPTLTSLHPFFTPSPSESVSKAGSLSFSSSSTLRTPGTRTHFTLSTLCSQTNVLGIATFLPAPHPPSPRSTPMQTPATEEGCMVQSTSRLDGRLAFLLIDRDGLHLAPYERSAIDSCGVSSDDPALLWQITVSPFVSLASGDIHGPEAYRSRYSTNCVAFGLTFLQSRKSSACCRQGKTQCQRDLFSVETRQLTIENIFMTSTPAACIRLNA